MMRCIILNIDNAKTAIFFTNDYHSYRGGDSPSDFQHITIKNLVCNIARGRAIDIAGLPDQTIKLVLRQRSPCKLFLIQGNVQIYLSLPVTHPNLLYLR